MALVFEAWSGSVFPGLSFPKWYGVAYAAGFLWGWKRFQKTLLSQTLTPNQRETLFFWGCCAVVVGGRLGAVFLYEWDYYRVHLLEIIEIWKPGMAFHGGLLGVMAVSGVLARAWKRSLLEFFDAATFCAPPALGCVRVANFINQELCGKPTDVPWAVVLPLNDWVPRHPSQLYEAFLEGFVLTLVMNAALKRSYKKPGFMAFVFALAYGSFRCFAEIFRTPDGVFYGLSLGQWYSVPLIILGAAGLFVLHKKR